MPKMGQEGEPESSCVTSSPLQFFSQLPLTPNLGPPYPWLRELKSEERGLYLIQLLLCCANHVATGSLENANLTLDHISHLASPYGDTMQRIAAYFSEALADRTLKALPGLYRALNCTKISLASERVLAQRLFFELFPFLKVAYVVTNLAIIEAMEGEKMVHILDLNCFEPAQWINLLQAFRARPEGPPHLRITGIHERKEVLEHMSLRLTDEADKLDIPFQFNAVVGDLENLDLESLRVKTGEALAICSALKLHSLLASENGTLRRNPLSINNAVPNSNVSCFLSGLWGLSPKLMVVTEQEASNNGSTLIERVTEALYFYAALFDCLESSIPRVSIERQKVEKVLFGEEIKNIVACEGSERKERHEKLKKWVPRIEAAGFAKVPFGYHLMMQSLRLLQTNGYEKYSVKDENGRMLICWQDRPLFFVSAWRYRRGEL